MIERLKNFPRKPDMLVYALRAAAALMARAWMKIYHRYEIIGRENIPDTQSFVIVANHSSHLDVASIVSAMPVNKLHRIFPAAAKDYFFATTPKTIFSAIFVNALPFDRKSNSRESLGLCCELLNTQGNVLLLFPEGTRSKTGQLQTFKAGIGLLLSQSPHPVLPCHIDGAYRSLPKGKCLPRPAKIRIKIGKPMNFKDYKRGKASALKISSELYEAVQALNQR